MPDILADVSYWLSDLVAVGAPGLVITLLVWGLFNCFLGYPLFRFGIMVIGLLVGGLLGAILGLALLPSDFSGSLYALVLCIIMGGWTMMALTWYVHSIALFLYGAYVAFLAVLAATVIGRGLPDETLLVAVPIGGGVLAVALEKHLVVISSGLSGAACVALGIAICGVLPPWVLVLVWLSLAVWGITVQYDMQPEVTEVVEGRFAELMEGRSTPRSSEEEGETVLHGMAKLGNLNAVLALIERGDDVNARDRLGQTPLHLAAGDGHVDIARVLIRSRANVNARDDAGNTPLYHAIRWGHHTLAALLREHEGQT